MVAIGVDDGVGLMATWADVDPNYLTRYQQWLNCEHMPERVSITGFLQGRRYRSIEDRPHYLVFYEAKTTSVLGSDEYIERLNTPTPWTLEALGAFQGKPVRNIYSRIAVAGKPRQFIAPFVISVRFDLVEGGQVTYAERWIKATAEDDDKVERIRLYKQDSAIGNIQTSERKIYGAGPGEQAYLLLIEYAKPPGSVSDLLHRWDAALGTQSQRANEERGAYWLEMFHRKREIA